MNFSLIGQKIRVLRLIEYSILFYKYFVTFSMTFSEHPNKSSYQLTKKGILPNLLPANPNFPKKILKALNPEKRLENQDIFVYQDFVKYFLMACGVYFCLIKIYCIFINTYSHFFLENKYCLDF